MVLENFLADADILWDRAGKELYEKPEARTGRIMRVRVTNRGVVEDLTGYTLNLGWKSTVDETKFGLDAFEVADATKGIFELEYTSGMLTNIGTLKAALQLVPIVGNTIESNNFVITVTKSAVDAEAIQSESSFSTLTTALVQVNGWNATIGGKISDWEADMAATKQTYIDTMKDVEATYPQELVSLTSQLADKAEKADLTNDRTFVGADTVANIIASEDVNQGDYYYATDAEVYYLYGTEGWVNIGNGNTIVNAITTTVPAIRTEDTYLVRTGVQQPLVGSYIDVITEVEENDRLFISGRVGDAARLYATYDSKGDLLDIFPAYDQGYTMVRKTYSNTLVVPKGVSKIVTCNATVTKIPPMANPTETLNDVKSRVGALEGAYNTVESTLFEEVDLNIITEKYLIWNGSIGSVSNPDYGYARVNLTAGKDYLISASARGLQRAYMIKNLSTNEVTIFPNGTNENLDLIVYKDIHLNLPYPAELTISSAKLSESPISLKGFKGDKTVTEIDDTVKHLVHRVACIGDSLTRGAYYGFGKNGSHIMEGYPYYLKQLNLWTTANLGKSGATPVSWWSDVRPNYGSVFSDYDTFIIWLGTNQGLTDTIETDTASGDYTTYAETNTGYYCKIIEYVKAQRPTANIFLLTTFNAPNLEITNSVINKIGVKYGLPVFEMNDGSLFGGEEQAILHPFNNVTHFGKVGNLKVAKKVTDYMTEYINDNLSQFEEPYVPMT